MSDAQYEYFARFRPCSKEQQLQSLIEDIPLARPRGEEEQFLAKDERMLEARELFQRALAIMERALSTPDQRPEDIRTARFNAANMCSRIGLIDRMRREYESAEEMFKKSISILSELAAEDITSQRVSRELAIAWERLGLVYGGCFRERKLQESLVRAHNALEKAIILYEQVGEDSSDTQAILSSLNSKGHVVG